MNRRDFLQGMAALAGVAAITKYDPAGRIAALELPGDFVEDVVPTTGVIQGPWRDWIRLNGTRYALFDATISGSSNLVMVPTMDGPSFSTFGGPPSVHIEFRIPTHDDLAVYMEKLEPLPMNIEIGQGSEPLAFYFSGIITSLYRDTIDPPLWGGNITVVGEITRLKYFSPLGRQHDNQDQDDHPQA